MLFSDTAKQFPHYLKKNGFPPSFFPIYNYIPSAIFQNHKEEGSSASPPPCSRSSASDRLDVRTYLYHL